MSDSNITVLYSDVNTMWTLIGAALVFFMQAGFAAVEAGFTRSKNSGNIIMKNLMDFSIGTPLYWFTGFGIMFGTQSAFFGGLDFFAKGDYSAILPDGVSFFTYFIFQTVFCATAATIVSGAMAERTKFSSYCIYSAVISLIIYPVSGHWIWGGGWLAQMGFHDLSGSCAIHMVGGICALIGAWMLGPRIGKFTKDKNGKIIMESDVVTGGPSTGNDTPKGAFRVYNKKEGATLYGPGYWTTVSYWVGIYEDIGFHDATWRDEFGADVYLEDGSHGCVNLPIKSARKIYDEAYIDMPVFIY